METSQESLPTVIECPRCGRARYLEYCYSCEQLDTWIAALAAHGLKRLVLFYTPEKPDARD